MLVIRNYGHLWDRELVFWGWPRVEGHLKGIRKGTEADFREQIAVYVLYDSDRNPIYVGQAGYGPESKRRLFARLKAHNRDSTKIWRYFSWFGMKSVNANGSLSQYQKPRTGVRGKKIVDGLNEVEAVLIHVLNPRSNRRGGNWGDAKHFHEFQDERMFEVDSDDVAIFELRTLQRQLRKIQKKLGIP
jgi:hypothetical protein